MRTRIALTAVLVAAGGLVAGPPATAGPVCGPNEQLNPVEVPVPVSDRLETIEVDDWKVNVLLPPGYDDAPDARYPVLYILHGGGWGEEMGPDLYLSVTSVIDYSASGPGVIVVMPFGGTEGWYSDWPDGVLAWESFHIRRLIPHIDGNYRTIADGRHRAVAGESMGGYGALHYAARYPHLFAAAGSFSGLIDTRLDGPVLPLGFMAVLGAYNAACYDGALTGPWGPGDELTTANHNPTDIVGNLGNTAVYASAGNGVPCDDTDVERFQDGYTILEPLMRVVTESFVGAARRAAVAHTADLTDCGTHDAPYIDAALGTFWPIMLGAFGRPVSAFDHRAADATFSVWDWTFTADPDRAPEFLDVADASCDGFGLTGSGRTTVTTAPCFAPGATVLANGVAHTADDGGRVTVEVDLGPPHAHQQFTPAARASEAASIVHSYWTSRTVRFVTPGR